jgi:hypothetical protein
MTMRTQSKSKAKVGNSALTKEKSRFPALIATGAASIAIRAGTVFAGRRFRVNTPLPPPDDGYQPGGDYAVMVTAKHLHVAPLSRLPHLAGSFLGGFHYAPGGNATARAGGDNIPVINPYSLWDLTFRPSCADPRGMALVTKPGGKFWCDIYLTASDHLAGTSRFGAAIADHYSPPQNSAGGRFDNFNFSAANAVMTDHGKRLLSVEEFFAAAHGVTERTSRGTDPKITGIDAPRTSKFGLMQATGNMWTWVNDGDPDHPSCYLVGGNWDGGGNSGSRASDWSYAPSASNSTIGARGACDHLQPV